MYALIFEQMQAALRDDPSDWAGVIDVETPAGWFYVATVSNIGLAVCAPGHWPAGADITIRVLTTDAWTGSVTSPETLPAIVDAGLVTTDDPDPRGAKFAYERWGVYLQKRADYVAAHPAP
ncbi:MAG TPA: hypothetical protein PK948_08130 [Gemmatimonadales bacterium]|nr:hypothetical protein [Gemmatimonadales bacterium]